MRKLPWSDADIASSYRSAADQEAQVKILAELNAASEKEIREALAREGIVVTVRRGRRKKADTATTGYMQPVDMPPEQPGVLTVYPDPDDEGELDFPESEVKEVFIAVLEVLEAVPAWASQYTRDRAAELADGIVRDFFNAWKTQEIHIRADEDGGAEP